VEETGWSLEYVDGLSLSALHEYLQVKDGIAKGRNSLFNKGH
jgi:hypothetical protein